MRMATAAQSVSATPSSLAWVGEFLRDELSPYQGRAALVARMVIASTLGMITCMVFRIPYAFQAAIYALIVSRESSQATLKSSASILALTGIGGAYLLASAWFVISIPALHLLWVIASFFLGFYAISTINNFGASSTFAIMICVGVPLWGRHLSAGRNVEDTLWLCLACAIGVVVIVGVEILFSRIKPGEDIVAGVADRLVAVENLLLDFANNGSVDRLTQANVVRLAMVGTSMFRRILQRSAYSPNYAEQMGAVIALTGRLVDLAANLSSPIRLSGDDREQIRLLAESVGRVRSALLAKGSPLLHEFHVTEGNAPHAIPLVTEMEKTVQLINEALIGPHSLGVFAPQPASGDPQPSFFARDAITNVKHIQFALKGCLTASLCYIIYNGVDWPGISTAVTTCFLTALSNVGSSRQKQVLRISGAVVGGFLRDGLTSVHLALPGFDCWIHPSFCRCHRLRILVHDFQPALVLFWRSGRSCFLFHPSQFIRNRAFALDRQRSCRRHLVRIDHDVAGLRSTMGSIRRLRHEEGFPFGGSLAGPICTRADLQRLQRGRGTQLLPP